MAEEDEEEVNKELLLLALQQEKLLAELKLAYAAEEGDDDPDKMNAEMEARIRALNAGRPVSIQKITIR